MTFGYRDKFHTTDDQHVEDHTLEELEDGGEGTGPALEEPTGDQGEESGQ